MFFSFDGVDGVGKSTQIRLFAEWLKTHGDVVECRDPGTTAIGESLRSLLLGTEDPLHMRTEMMMYMTARTQLVEEIIRPALEAGKHVISDRYLLANIAYQGYGGELPLEDLRSVGNVAVGGLYPDRTFVLDMDPQQARARMPKSKDRVESREAEYWEKVREGFLAESRRDDRILIVDAGREIATIHDEIRSLAESALRERKGER